MTEKLWQPVMFKRPDLVESVCEHLRTEILNGTFAPGSALPSEAELAEAYHVSRRVIRETLRVLSTQGLVELSQGRKPIVRHADNNAAIDTLRVSLERSSASLLHLFEARRPLEIESVALAAQRALMKILKTLKMH